MDREDLLCVAFATLTGYVNTITLIRYGVFAAALTGNLIFVAMTVYRCNAPGHRAHGCPSEFWDALFCFAIIACNLLGVYAFCAACERWPDRTTSVLAPLLALLMCASDVVQETCIQLHGLEDGIEEELSQWSVCFIAFAMGGFNFISMPAAPRSKLKIVTSAATAHLQTNTFLLHRWLSGATLTSAQRQAGARACLVVLGITVGVIVGALALLFNPLAPPADRWLFTVSGLCLLLTLRAHDDAHDDVAARQREQLREPLHPSTSADKEAALPAAASTPRPGPASSSSPAGAAQSVPLSPRAIVAAALRS